jgi:thioredoxin 1
MASETDNKTAPIEVFWFTRPGCGVCSTLRPRVAKMLEESFPGIPLRVIDCEKQPGQAGSHQVFAVPTALIMIEGREATRLARGFALDQLRMAIERPYQLLHGDS